MTLIKSISGIRGTIGGKPGEGLSPVDIVKFVYAYYDVMVQRNHEPKNGAKWRVVVGKDARISGEMVEHLVIGTLIACGVDVVCCEFASTPTTELAVQFSGADGGIILTASHNPKEWNALKLLNEDGEFLSAARGQAVLDCAESGDFNFAEVGKLGKVVRHEYIDEHVDMVVNLPAVDVEAIQNAHFKVVLDPINSVGATIMPRLLGKLGVDCIIINGVGNGQFAHNPEPLPKNLADLSAAVVANNADLGISVDPDVDRLALICEDGTPFIEENTLVAVADYLLAREVELGHKDFCTVSNLSSSRALKDVTEKYGGKYYAAAVGEVNVTTKMHAVGAIIGGEGNGGVIYPECHYGRDAMVGVALILSHLAHLKMKLSDYRNSLPQYSIVKEKIHLSDKELANKILDSIKEYYKDQEVNTLDGVRVDFEQERKWVILRRSNTEPIIRVYAEARTEKEARILAAEVQSIASTIINNEIK